MIADRNRPSSSRDVEGRRVGPGQKVLDDFTYTVIEVPFRLGVDKRTDRRVRTRLHEGLISERRGSAIVECRIRDRSRDGARLQLDKARPLPRTFVLTDTATRSYFSVVLVWQVGREAGVKITSLKV